MKNIILDLIHQIKNSTVSYLKEAKFWIGSHRIKKHKKYSSYDRDSRDSGERKYDRHEKRSRHRSRGGKLETLNITKCLRKIQRRYLNDVVVKELITSIVHHLHPMHLVIDAFHGLGTYQPNFNGLTIPT